MTQAELNQKLTELIITAESLLTVKAAELISLRSKYEDLKLNVKKEQLTHICGSLYLMVRIVEETMEITSATLFPDGEHEKSPSDTSAQAASGEPD